MQFELTSVNDLQYTLIPLSNILEIEVNTYTENSLKFLIKNVKNYDFVSESDSLEITFKDREGNLVLK